GDLETFVEGCAVRWVHFTCHMRLNRLQTTVIHIGCHDDPHAQPTQRRRQIAELPPYYAGVEKRNSIIADKVLASTERDRYSHEDCSPCQPSGPTLTEITRILSAIHQGDAHAAERLLPLVYDELRKLAAQKLARETPGQTLDATALVHEAYLRLVDTRSVQ